MRRLATTTIALAGAALLGLAGCGSSNNVATPGSDFCNSAKNLTALFSLSQATDLNSMKQQVRTLTDAVDKMDSSAPSDIANDMHTLRSAIDDANGKAQSANNTDDIGNAFSNPSNSSAVDSAGTRVDAYVQQHCGINLNGGGTSSSVSQSSSSSAETTSTDTGLFSSST